MRINLFGGPGLSKTTLAAYLFYELKLRNCSVELVQEWVKAYAYAKRKIGRLDQIYIFSKQFNSEHKFLAHGVKHIVTDSPLLLAAVYSTSVIRSCIIDLEEEYEIEYPSLNILLERGTMPYISHGRYQTEKEAREIDGQVRALLDKLRKPYLEFMWNDKEGILKAVLEAIGESNGSSDENSRRLVA